MFSRNYLITYDFYDSVYAKEKLNATQNRSRSNVASNNIASYA
jgi:hypothetical protein